jgi:uncharacterized protein
MTTKPIYETDTECPLCSKKFKVTKTRIGIPMVGLETDFRMRYQGVDPYLYMVWVCPHCGYAAPDTCFAPLSDMERNKLSEVLKGKRIGIDLQGERTPDQALASYKLALYFSQLRNLPASQIGGLFLKMAWLHRDKHAVDEEQRCLSNAVECYVQAYANETFPIGRMTETSLEYLVAELYHRIGRYEEAAKWLGKVLNQRRSQGEARIIDMARDLWQILKEKRAGAGTVE